jgi:hypothetical protein
MIFKLDYKSEYTPEYDEVKDLINSVIPYMDVEYDIEEILLSPKFKSVTFKLANKSEYFYNKHFESHGTYHPEFGAGAMQYGYDSITDFFKTLDRLNLSMEFIEGWNFKPYAFREWLFLRDVLKVLFGNLLVVMVLCQKFLRIMGMK